MGAIGNIVGDVLGGGGKPKVPPWVDVSLPDAQDKAIAANQNALPASESLASQANLFSQQQIEKMLESAIPGYTSLRDEVTGNINSMVRGELPSDVARAVETSDASRSVTGGYGGTGFGRNLTSRDLGLTSLNLMETGTSAAESWIGAMDRMFSPGMMSVESMFITPAQEYSAMFQNAENKWNVQWLKNQIASQPDPLMRDVGQMVGGIGDAVLSYYTGGMWNSVGSGQGGGGGGGGTGTGSTGGFNLMSFLGGGNKGGSGAPDWASNPNPGVGGM